MISFYPGPSRVHDEIPKYVKDAHREGILGMNHRSEEFVKISLKTNQLLKNRLNIPENFSLFYTSSATECWEIIAQSVVTKSSLHLFNGAFGKKWFEYTLRLNSGAKSSPFDQNESINVKKLRVRKDTVICLTQNETSNGTQVSNATIKSIKEQFPGNLIAVDATSSMAGVFLDFTQADIWFASVQKCFGLPAGLGLMICSPAAIAKAKAKNEHSHYNSLTFMAEMMEQWQTPYTPNVLNMYLLMRVLEDSRNIQNVHEKIVERHRLWVNFFSEKKTLHHLIANEDVRSLTVIPIVAEEGLVTIIKTRAKKQGLLLGEGYGALKPNTFRIANFPAIKKREITKLKKFLSAFD